MNSIKSFIVVSYILLSAVIISLGQENIIMTGKVLDAKTKRPLVNASIGLKSAHFSTSSEVDGSFKFLFPDKFSNDSLFVSYVGYKAFTDKITELDLTDKVYLLEESSTLLDEVTILEQRLYKFEIKKLEASMKQIKGNLYASKTEVTNQEYSQFLGYLLRSNQASRYEKYKPDITQYDGALLTFFKGYHLVHRKSKETKYDKDYSDDPVVNISYEAAIAYCEWFTELYNNTQGKKKFTKVKFRLPQLKEWQIAALGYPKFQSWDIEENEVEVGIPKYPGEEVAIKYRIIPVKGNDILYPWYTVYNYRNKAQNNKNCWLGNFKVPPGSALCLAMPPSGDGFAVTAMVASYFPNGMGLYDVVGNAAEMIDEKGKACGGSWDHAPEESTILSVLTFKGPQGTVGFRVFMDVLVEK